MSYISNGCNDCSSVDFGNNGMMGGGMMGGGMMGGNQYETQNSASQFVYQPTPMPQMQQQAQQPQQPQFQQPQLQQQQQFKQPQMVQMAPQQPKAPVKMQQQVSVVAPVQQKQQSSSVTGVLGNYFYDNAFTITIAFLVASAWHTTIKYYIDHAIKFSGGTPTYYVAYAVLATIAAIFLTTLKQ
jgi:predicted lipid-binding transport protein (Tim44 family)